VIFREINELASRTGIEPKKSILAAPDSAEKQKFLQLLEDSPEALFRSCRPAHLTGSALVLDPSTHKVLMLFHTKLQRWLQPGGHADGDGDLARVALREAIEETGIPDLRVFDEIIDLDIHEVNPPKEDRHHHYDVRFLVLAPKDSVPVKNHESQEIRWIEIDSLDQLAVDEGVHRLARRCVRKLKEA
jgi:8-oxo-dGTP pyrophosphatase MutT (NUDIX family)